MDVRTICLGILTRGNATGYEIRKTFEESGLQNFVEASFGSIYPALGRLTEEGLVSVREESQEKRPDRKVYSITPQGRTAFLSTLMRPLAEDKHRSPFVFAMLFSDLLPDARVDSMIDSHIAQSERQRAQLEEKACGDLMPGERFAIGLGHTIYTAILEFLRAHRADLKQQAIEAAE
jgi:DNA-binding PadR family transcriptional regulator